MTVILECVSRYRRGDREYLPGQELHLTDAQADYLRRDSPGSFKVREEVAPNPEPEVVVASKMSSGLKAPDRRSRGGRKRTSG